MTDARASVRFVREGLEVEVDVGTTLLAAARSAGAPEGSHCGGVCSCSSCHVYIHSGAELLSRSHDDERDLIARADAPAATSRLGCQATIVTPGTLVVEISEESFQTFLDMNPDEAERVLRLRGIG